METVEKTVPQSDAAATNNGTLEMGAIDQNANSGITNGPLDHMNEASFFPLSKEQEIYAAKLAYANTMSSLINKTSVMYGSRVNFIITPHLAQLDSMLLDINTRFQASKDNLSSRQSNQTGETNDNETQPQDENTQDNGVKLEDETPKSLDDLAPMIANERNQCILNAIRSISQGIKPFIDEAVMATRNGFVMEAVGMLKAITDTFCRTAVDMKGRGENLDFSQVVFLFDQVILKPWAGLLVRLPADVRSACANFLQHEIFRPFIDDNSMNGQFNYYVSQNEGELDMLRSPDDKQAFELNSRQYEQEQYSCLISMNTYPPIDGQESGQKRRSDGGNPPRKRRKKSHWQMYREDGSKRKQQKNPNPLRKCKRMWQDDGVSRGCGENSHPRGVCPCWKERGFSKDDVKNGKIKAWLEATYGRPYDT